MEPMSNKSIIKLLVGIMLFVLPFMIYLSSILPGKPPAIDDESIEVISIQAEDLINEFYNNEVKAKSDYTMQWLEVDGKILSISGKKNKATLRFYNGEFLDFMTLTCYINGEKEVEAVKDLNKGDRVTVNGRIPRKFLGNIELRSCTIKK